jgi:hypothetical protein
MTSRRFSRSFTLAAAFGLALSAFAGASEPRGTIVSFGITRDLSALQVHEAPNLPTGTNQSLERTRWAG